MINGVEELNAFIDVDVPAVFRKHLLQECRRGATILGVVVPVRGFGARVQTFASLRLRAISVLFHFC